MAEPKWLQDLKEEDYIKEDFDATGKSRYTVEGVDKNDPDWLHIQILVVFLKIGY